MGDFDGDGRADILATYARSGARFSFGHGDGTFDDPIVVDGLEGPVFEPTVAVADFRAEGHMSALFARSDMDRVTLVQFDAKRTVIRTELSLPCGSGFRDLTAADFDRDGHVDVVVSHELGLCSFRASSDGSFVAGSTVALTALNLTPGDLDGDHVPDLVFTTGSGEVASIRGRGDLSFEAPVSFPKGTGFSDRIAVADLDGDGRDDVAVPLFGGTLSVLRVRFARDGFRPVDMPLLPQPFDAVVADFDGDCHVDILVSNVPPSALQFEPSNLPELTLLRGLGDGRFDPPKRFNVAGRGLLAVGYLDQDRRLDVVLGDALNGGNRDSAIVLSGP